MTNAQKAMLLKRILDSLYHSKELAVLTYEDINTEFKDFIDFEYKRLIADITFSYQYYKNEVCD